MIEIANLDKVLNYIKSTQFNFKEGEFSQETKYEFIERLCQYCPSSMFNHYCGISKLVLSFEELPNYVIKIPFTWYAQGDERYAYRVDYCEIECEIYQYAQCDNADCLLAKEWQVAKVNNHPIYIQEKVIYCDNEDKIAFTPANNQEDSYQSYCQQIKKASRHAYYATEDKVWNYNVCQHYGFNEGIRLLTWLSNNCDDLHNANIGYKADGAPVVFDYSGVG